MWKKQVCKGQGTLKMHAACSLQSNVEDVKDIKTSHNRFHSVYLFPVKDTKNVYELQCRF